MNLVKKKQYSAVPKNCITFFIKIRKTIHQYQHYKIRRNTLFLSNLNTRQSVQGIINYNHEQHQTIPTICTNIGTTLRNRSSSFIGERVTQKVK